MRGLLLFATVAVCAGVQAMPLGLRTAMWGIDPVQRGGGGGDPWEGEVEEFECIVGEKVEFDVGLVGYAAKNLPGGLSYASKTGKVSGAAKKPAWRRVRRARRWRGSLHSKRISAR